jgi:hypothetical protein
MHMRKVDHFRATLILITIFLVVFAGSCDRTSSPEGRMSIRIENLQKQMTDSLRQQNRAILDSLGKIRAEIEQLKQARK